MAAEPQVTAQNQQPMAHWFRLYHRHLVCGTAPASAMHLGQRWELRRSGHRLDFVPAEICDQHFGFAELPVDVDLLELERITTPRPSYRFVRWLTTLSPRMINTTVDVQVLTRDPKSNLRYGVHEIIQADRHHTAGLAEFLSTVMCLSVDLLHKDALQRELPDAS